MGGAVLRVEGVVHWGGGRGGVIWEEPVLKVEGSSTGEEGGEGLYGRSQYLG